MQIDINRQKFSFGDKYDIYKNESLVYQAANKLLKLFAVIELVDVPDENLCMTIKRKWGFGIANYDLLSPDGRVYNFKTTSFWKIQYQCTVDRDVYDIYGHRGRKHSIFKNGEQIGWWDEARVSWFNGDNCTIIANNNSNEILLISFCLIIENYSSSNKDRNALNINLGNLGFWSMKFDKNWQPK